jgi:toxin CcdB
MVGGLAQVVVRQYDICRNPDRSSRQRFPYLIVLQSDLLEPLDTVVAAPAAVESAAAIAKLNPTIEVLGKRHRIIMQELAGVARSRLGEVVGNARAHHPAFIAAIDLLFTGI